MDMKIEEICRKIEKIGIEEEIPMEIDPWDANLSSEQVHHSLDDYYPSYDPFKINASRLKIDLLQLLEHWDYHSKNYNYPGIEARSNNRGLVYVITVEKYINHYENNLPMIRHNKENFQQLFEMFNCDVKICSNTTAQGIHKEFNELSQAYGFDFFITFICGHGGLDPNGEEILYCSDYLDGTLNGTLKIIDIVKKFSVNNSPNWASKLKLFTIDICRARQPIVNNQLVTTDSFQSLIMNTTTTTINGREVNDFSDMLIVFGTEKKSYSHYTPSFGSLFYSLLCEIISKIAANTHLTEMFEKAGDRIINEIIPNYPEEFSSYQRVDVLPIRMKSKPIYLNLINEKVYNRLITFTLKNSLCLMLMCIIVLMCIIGYLFNFVISTKNYSEKSDCTKKIYEYIILISFILKPVYEYFTIQNF